MWGQCWHRHTFLFRHLSSCRHEWEGGPGHDFKTPYINDELKGLNRTTMFYYSGKIGVNKRV